MSNSPEVTPWGVTPDFSRPLRADRARCGLAAAGMARCPPRRGPGSGVLPRFRVEDRAALAPVGADRPRPLTSGRAGGVEVGVRGRLAPRPLPGAARGSRRGHTRHGPGGVVGIAPFK